MEPRIQYATTSDGVSIAYWALGEGLPFVHMPWFRASHVQLEWQILEYRRWYESLAANRQLIRYDGRGIGLSDRKVSDYSLDALVSDLEAVVDRMELNTFALFGLLHGGPVAIAYAARHPERVSHLILWCTYARSVDYAQSTEIQALRILREKDWPLYTETMAHVRLGWSEGSSARQFARLIRESMTPQALESIQDAYRDLDVSDLLPMIRAPALVLHRSDVSWLPLEVARGLTSAIPGAGLTVLPGSSGAPFLDDADAVVRAIDEFVGLTHSQVATQVIDISQRGALQTILFTDIEGSTALTERLGDAQARELMREHERSVREALASHGGSEIKTMGDGFMASFGSAAKALECAVAIQKACDEQNRDVGARQLRDDVGKRAGSSVTSPLRPAAETHREPIRVRIGLNAGEPVAEGGDLYGTAVNMAARIAGHARAGEILVSDVVRQLVAGKGFAFKDRDEAALKGFEEPVKVYEARWREAT